MADDLDRALALSLETHEAEAKAQQSLRDEEYCRELALHQSDEKAADYDSDYALALKLQSQSEDEDYPSSVKHGPASARSSSSRGLSGLMNSLGSMFGGGAKVNHQQNLASDDMTCCVCGDSSPYRSTITAANRKYCAECFRCHNCKHTLHGQYFQNDKTKSSGAIYCGTCIKTLFGMKCSVCDGDIQGRYMRHNFFDDEKYCITHEDLEARRKCFSCSRLEPIPSPSKPPFVELPDTRVCCLECLSSAVMTTDEAASLYSSVVDFIENVLQLHIPQGMREVPVMAVDVHSLNEQRSQGSTTHGHGGHLIDYSQGGGTTVRGLTLSRHGEVQHFGLGDMTFDFTRGFQVNKPRVTRVDTIREVTAVIVLYGLPRDLASAILAHEALHVWFKLQKEYPVAIDPATEEGLCQVVGHKYLQYLEHEEANHAPSPAISAAVPSVKFKPMGSRVRTGGFAFHAQNLTKQREDSNKGTSANNVYKKEHSREREKMSKNDPNMKIESKLRKFFLHSIETDRSPVYGDGFRSANRSVDTLGMHITLEHVKDSKHLPNI
jgi:hypothetical protein